MKTLYIMCGVAYSGKSTLAKRIAAAKQAVLVSQDDLWFAKKEEWGLDWDSDEDWERIQHLSRAEVRKHLTSGASVVYDDLGLRYVERELLRDLAKECGAVAVLAYLDTPRDIQRARQASSRETNERHDVPDHIVDWGLEQLEIPQEAERPFIFMPDTEVTEWLIALP